MTKNYFVNKMIERGICSKISKMTPQEFQLKWNILIDSNNLFLSNYVIY